MLEKIVMYLFGAATTGVGWLIMRWLRKDHITEEINRRANTAKLIATMREQGVSRAEVDAVLAWIEPRGGQRTPQSVEDQLEEQEYAEIARAENQAAMNEVQRRRLTRLDRRMRAALEDLSELLDDDMKPLLARSQAAWEDYRDNMTEFAGAPWGNGTMRPFIEAGIQSRLTKQRAGELEAELVHARAALE